MTINSEHIPAFRAELLRWFGRVARELPWRDTRDPYPIWISEIMLQQTRVDQARPYFERFMQAFPDVESLAAADLDEVLRLWEGLGYYSRARNLHKTARIVVEEHGGTFPSHFEGLLDLPGIGEYTAAAIASIAYREPVAAVDGNVGRVLARVYAIEEDVRSGPGRAQVRDLARSLVDPGEPGTFNEAVMELGATVCTPRNPSCTDCPISAACAAYRMELVDELPFRRPSKPVPHHQVAVGVVRNGDKVLLVKRSDTQLLGGLWEYPGARLEESESLEEACRRGVVDRTGQKVVPTGLLSSFDHQYSHFKITVSVFECALEGSAVEIDQTMTAAWTPIEALAEVAMHRSSRRISNLIAASP